MTSICLISIFPSHYRDNIYRLLDKELHCSFIFGEEKTSIKKMDTSRLSKAQIVPNKYLLNTHFYYQPGTCALSKEYNVIINDLGIFSITAWAILIRAKIKKQRVYHWDHGWYGRENILKQILKRLYFGLADGAFIYGDRAIRLMIEKGFNSGKLYAIHNSLDYDAQIKIRQNISQTDVYKSHFKNDNKTICFIGRLTKMKKLEMVIEALSILKNNGAFYNLVLVGDGEMKSHLEEKTRYFGLESQVWFYGACYDERTNADLIYNADLCVSPGNVGLTAIYSMMFGCPVITHNRLEWQGPESEAIKDGRTGTFFKWGDTRSLAGTVTRWIEEHNDDREEVRRNCYKEIDGNWTPQFQYNVIKKVIGNE